MNGVNKKIFGSQLPVWEPETILCAGDAELRKKYGIRFISSLFCKKRNRSHTQTHDNNNTTNDHTKNHPPH